MQDFSPLEVRVLLDCLDERRSLTLAGDTQQHVVPARGFTSWSELLRRSSASRAPRSSTLQVSYRSLARDHATSPSALLGDLREDDAPATTTRSGPPVELFRFTEHGACVAFLADALTHARAPRSRSPRSACSTPSRDARRRSTAQGLAQCEVPRLHRVARQDFRFAPGVEVTEVEQVKGLEFDYVILVEASAAHYPDDARSRRLLHVGATRAVHQLWLTTVGTPSPVVTGAIAASGR